MSPSLLHEGEPVGLHRAVEEPVEHERVVGIGAVGHPDRLRHARTHIFQRSLKQGARGSRSRRPMAYRSLRDFLDRLERAGELVRVREPVDLRLDMAALADRAAKQEGPALLFEKPSSGAHAGGHEPLRHPAPRRLGALLRGPRGAGQRAARAAQDGAAAGALGQAQDDPEARASWPRCPRSTSRRGRCRRWWTASPTWARSRCSPPGRTTAARSSRCRRSSPATRRPGSATWACTAAR